MAAGGSGNQQGFAGGGFSKAGSGYMSGNGGGFGAMGSPSATGYRRPSAPMTPSAAAAPKPFAPMMPQMMPGQFLGVGGQGLPAYGAQVPGFSFFGPSYGGAVPGGMFPGLMQGGMMRGPRPGVFRDPPMWRR